VADAQIVWTDLPVRLLDRQHDPRRRWRGPVEVGDELADDAHPARSHVSAVAVQSVFRRPGVQLSGKHVSRPLAAGHQRVTQPDLRRWRAVGTGRHLGVLAAAWTVLDEDAEVVHRLPRRGLRVTSMDDQSRAGDRPLAVLACCLTC
jgi:hypothetical protein